MDYNKTILTKPDIWNRRIITSYWLICLVYLIGEFTILYLRIKYYPELTTEVYVKKYMILPNILLVVVMLFTELHYRFSKKHKDELTILSAILLADVILITINPIIDGSQFVLFLPILISICYFNKNLLIFTLIFDMSSFTLIYLLSPNHREYITIVEFALAMLILIGATIAGYGVIKRGEELVKNIEELVKSEEKLLVEKTIIDKLSKMDALTNLYNHITFHEYLDSIISQCDQNGMSLQLALLDIDDFKKINDIYGHRTGDTILKKISQVILKHMTPDDFAARYGGDEFALVFVGKSERDSYSVVEQIRMEVGNSFFIESAEEKVTISIGLQNYSRNDGKESLFHKADSSLYTAKSMGKNETICAKM